MFKVALVYESGKRYIFPFEIVEKVVRITEDDMRKIEIAIKKEIAKGG